MQVDAQSSDPALRKGWGTKVVRITIWLIAAMALLALIAFSQRREIADNLIADELQKRDIPATYKVEDIGPRRQILRDLVIGDPANPDLVIDEAIVDLDLRLGTPYVDKIIVKGARVYGRQISGPDGKPRISLGVLDPLIYTGSTEPFSFPDLAVQIIDGRALLATDYGLIAARIEGDGNLAQSYDATMALVARDVAGAGCALSDVSLYGQVKIRNQRPEFSGPLRWHSLRCSTQNAKLGKGAAQLDLGADAALAVFNAKVDGRAEAVSASGFAARRAVLRGNLGFAQGVLKGPVALGLAGLGDGASSLGQAGIAGNLIVEPAAGRYALDGDAVARDIRVPASLWQSLEPVRRASAGTLAAPLLDRMVPALRRAITGSSGSAQFSASLIGDRRALLVPNARLTSAGGERLLAVDGLSFERGGRMGASLQGRFALQGRDLPSLSGDFRSTERGGAMGRIVMQPYQAGDSRLAIPALMLALDKSGALGFSGRLAASGTLPGGFVQGLDAPVSGNWSARGGLALYRACTDLRFASLRLASLTLDNQALRLCPPPGRAIVQSGAAGTRIAAGIPALALKGRVGDTPLALNGEAVGIAWPGQIVANNVSAVLGRADSQTVMQVARLDAAITSQGALNGRFTGGHGTIGAVPLNLTDIDANLVYRDSVLTLDNALLTVSDRAELARFNPLKGRDGTLRFADNVITAQIGLREPRTDRMVSQVDIVHQLASSTGEARLAVAGIQFDDTLQPDDLTLLSRGVIANVKGGVRGDGVIRWNDAGVTSQGAFTTDSLDLAAAFGPVTGLKGTIRFSDLLGLETEANQLVQIASINPGVPVENGLLRYRLLPDLQMQIYEGRWPFMGGTLILEPTVLDMGEEKARNLAFTVDAMDAAKFLQQLEFENISATGVFDGQLPMVFDQNGGRVVGGRLVARKGGGSVAYIGELTYEDMGAITNFAFDALRSIRYSSLEILMDGAIDGELVTQIRFDGLQQGDGARRNFLTRQVAKLPIQFNVTVKAPFYQLITSARSLYDVNFVRDPRDLGLLPGGPAIPGAPGTSDTRNDKSIQPQESEPMP